jgi:hypothetical protein
VRAFRIIEDSRPPDDDLAEDRLERLGSSPSPLNAGAVLALATLEDQFLVGLLDEGPEESALDFEARLRDEGLDLVGEMLILIGHGPGHPERQFEGESPFGPVDGAASDGSLEVVGLAHDESP